MTNLSCKPLEIERQIESFTFYLSPVSAKPFDTFTNRIIRAEVFLLEAFELTTLPKMTIYLLDSQADLERVTAVQAAPEEFVRNSFDYNSLFLVLDPKQDLFEDILIREIGHFLFDKMTNDEGQQHKSFRSPFFLREGYTMQPVYHSSPDTYDLLYNGIKTLQVSLQDAGIHTIHGATSLSYSSFELDIFGLDNLQSFYMINFLKNIYCDKFLTKYSAMMAAIDYLDSESCFKQLTSMSFEKFLSLFADWLKKTKV